MKIRQGFVSNSSSSSFIALAFSVQKDSIPEKDLLFAVGINEDEYKEALEKETEDGKWSDKNAARELFWCQYDGVARKEGFRILSGSEGGIDKDDEVVAFILAEADSESGGFFNRGEIKYEEDSEEMKKIKSVRDKMNPVAKIRVIYGTRCC